MVLRVSQVIPGFINRTLTNTLIVTRQQRKGRSGATLWRRLAIGGIRQQRRPSRHGTAAFKSGKRWCVSGLQTCTAAH